MVAANETNTRLYRTVAATSSVRSGISASPTGFRDKASATVLRTPGMCSYAKQIPQRLLLNVP